MSIVAIPRKTLERLSKIAEPEDFKSAVNELMGNQRPIIMLNRILCATYIENEMTSGGIIKPLEVTSESIWQGKAFLVLDVGPAAFVDDERTSFYGQSAKPGDWVVFKSGNSTIIEVNKVPCRIVEDRFVEAIIPDPRMVW